MKARQLFSDADLKKIKLAVHAAEKLTSGEIRVYIEDHTEDLPLDRAAYLFGKLGMDKTSLRNGVLIYLACKDKNFCIIGDVGIHNKVGESFWSATSAGMKNFFSEGAMLQGVLYAVTQAGQKLADLFPYNADDKNELSDDILIEGRSI